MVKIRHDFITNSSSSSFVISKDKLTKEQIELLLNFDKLVDLAKEKYLPPCKEKEKFICEHELNCDSFVCDIYGWDIKSTDDKIYGYTIMDNFDMISFLEDLGIKLDEEDCGDFQAGPAGIAWLYKNHNIDPFNWFKNSEKE